ncbi:MAG: phytoene/squalene synthase family protein, partial [Thermogutta sp.]|nr:phytoene/squalene synthase family protein [Thermogutta sp.]
CRRAHSSFCSAFFLLPPDRARAMEALYAFLRVTDDLADAIPAGDSAAPDSDQASRRLDYWQTAFQSVQREGDAIPGVPPPDDPLLAEGMAVLPAAADTVRRYGVPWQALQAVIDGVRADLQPVRFQTFDQTLDYCRKVASAVGVACIHIWGFSGGAEALAKADACGIALQLTNILRDLAEDARRDRYYLPLEDFARFGLAPEDLLSGIVNEKTARWLEFQMDRTADFYRRGADLLPHLAPGGRRIFGLMTATYWTLFRRLRRFRGRLLRTRIRVPAVRILALAVRWAVLPPARRSLP